MKIYNKDKYKNLLSKLISKLKTFLKTLKWGAKIGSVILVVILILSISSSIYQFLNPKIVELEKWKTVEVTKWKTKRIEVPVEVVKDKEKIIGKLNLPDWVKEKEILSKVEVSPHEGKTDVVTTVDPKSGKVASLTKQHPRPFVSFRPKGYIGVDFSPIHSSSLGDWRVTGEYEAGRIGNIKPFVRGEIDQKGAYRVSGGLRYEF